MSKTTLEKKYQDYEFLTSQPDSPFYGMDPQEFSQRMGQISQTNRYDILDENKFMRGAQIAADSIDRLGNALRVNDKLGLLARGAADAFTDNEDTLNAAYSAGEGMFTNLVGLAALAIPVPGVNVALAGLIVGSDAYVDSREGGMSRGVSSVVGLISGTVAGLLPTSGKIFEGLGVKAATKMGLTKAAQAGVAANAKTGVNTFLNKSLSAAIPYITREVGQFGVGVAGDVATNLIDPNAELSDLTREEYVLPMLLGDSIFVVADVAIIKPAEIYRTRQRAKASDIENNLDAHEASNTRTETNIEWDEVSEYFDIINKQNAENFTPENPDFTKNLTLLGNLDTVVDNLYKADTPLYMAKAYTQGMISTTGVNSTTALRRYQEVLNDNKRNIGNQIPTNYRNTPNLRHAYKQHKEAIQTGQAELIYNKEQDPNTNSQQSITAVLDTTKDDSLIIYRDGESVGLESLDVLDKRAITLAIEDAAQRRIEQKQITIQNGGREFDPALGEKTSNLINELLDSLDVKTTVKISLDQNLDSAQKRFNLQKDSQLGATFFDPKLDHAVITLRKFDPENVSDQNTLLHELGHVVERHFATKNPVALKSIQDRFEKFKKPRKVKGSQSLVLPERIKAAKSDIKETRFTEWFANQYNKYVLDPDAKVSGVVERHFKSVVDAFRKLWAKIKGTAPDKDFRSWMDFQMRRMYMNIVKQGETDYKSIVVKYQLGDVANELIAKNIYQSQDPRFMVLLEDRLERWDEKGRVGNVQNIINQAARQYKHMPLRLGYTPEELFSTSEINERLAGQFREINQKQLERITGIINGHVDKVDALAIAQTLMYRWTQGELDGQHKTPRGKGIKLFEKALMQELKIKSVAKVESFYYDGGDLESIAKVKYYQTEEAARLEAANYLHSNRYGGETIHVLYDNKGWFIRGDRELAGSYVDFISRRSNAEMDEALDRTLQSRREFLREGVDSVTAREYAIGRGIEEFFLDLDPEITVEFVENKNAGSASQGFTHMLNEGTGPVGLVKAHDSLKRYLDREGTEQFNAIGKEFGWDKNNLNSWLVGAFEAISKGKLQPEIALWADKDIGNALIEVAKVAGKVTKLQEFGARLKTFDGDDSDVVGFINKRFQVDKVVDVESSNKRMAELVQNMSSGMGLEQLNKMKQKGGVWSKVYDAVQGNIFHLAQAHPELQPMAEYFAMEGADQSSMLSKILALYHNTDIKKLQKDAKADEISEKFFGDSGTKIRQDYQALNAYAQVARTTVPKLIKEGHEGVMEVWKNVSDKDRNIIMEMFQRQYNVQRANTEATQLLLREIDKISLARHIDKVLKTNQPRTALDMVKLLDETDPTYWMDMLMKGGLKDVEAQNIIQTKIALTQATETMVKQMLKSPEFVSERRYGRFLVRFNTEVDGKVKSGSESFNSYSDAEEFVNKNPAYKISSRGIEDTTLFKGRQSKDGSDKVFSAVEAKRSLLLNMIDEDSEVAGHINSAMDDILGSQVNEPLKGFGFERKFKLGRENLDPFEQQATYIQNNIVRLTKARTDLAFNLFRHDEMFKSDDGLRILGHASKALEKFRQTDSKLAQFVTKFGFVYFQGGNISSMVQEVVSIPWVVAPMAREAGLGFVESMYLPNKILKEWGKAKLDKNYKWKNPDHEQLLLRAAEEGRTTHRLVMEQNESMIRNEMELKKLATGNRKVNPLEGVYQVSGKLYSYANDVSATITLVTGYEAARKRNPGGTKEDWYSAAIDFHARANGAGGKLSRPNYIPQGAIGNAMWSMQSFAQSTIANWARWAHDGYYDGMKKNPLKTPEERSNARKAFNQAAGMTVVGMGLTGMVGVSAVSAIIEKITGINPEKEFENFLADDLELPPSFINFAMRGLTYSSGLPFDLQSRMSVGGLFMVNPFDGFNSSQVFGAPAAYIESGIKAFGHARDGDFGRGAAELLPIGLRRAARLWVDDGLVKAHNGDIVYDPDTAEQVFSIMGFTPKGVRQHYELKDTVNYFKAKETREKQEIVKTAVNLLKTGQSNKAQEYLLQKTRELATAETNDRTYNQLAGVVARSFAQSGEVVQPKLQNTAIQQSINSIHSNGRNVGNLYRMMQKQNTARQELGLKPTNNRQQMRQAGLADLMVNQNPNLNPYQALDSVRQAQNPQLQAYRIRQQEMMFPSLSPQ